MKEKQKFYDLLPDHEKRVLGKFLNINYDDLEDRVNLKKYFKIHMLPKQSWKGWGSQVDESFLQTRSEYLENTSIDIPSSSSLDKARAYTYGVEIPMVHHKTAGNISMKLRGLMSNGGLKGITNASYIIRPSNTHEVNVDMDVTHDDSEDKLTMLRKSL